jgi:hypothetical protein
VLCVLLAHLPQLIAHASSLLGVVVGGHAVRLLQAAAAAAAGQRQNGW